MSVEDLEEKKYYQVLLNKGTISLIFSSICFVFILLPTEEGFNIAETYEVELQYFPGLFPCSVTILRSKYLVFSLLLGEIFYCEVSLALRRYENQTEKTLPECLQAIESLTCY